MIEAIIVVAVLVIVAGGGYLYFTKNPDKVSLPKKNPSKEVSTEMELHIPEVIESEAAIQEPKHEVVRTWIGSSSVGDTYHWKCSCGVKDYTFFQSLAADNARRHVTDRNRELKMLRESNGQFGW